EESLTYAELNEKANVIAHKLREQGVKPNDFVAILAERSIEMIVGIYGIIKAGGAYVPIDPTYPEERIHYMLEDCAPKVILKYTTERIALSTEIPVIDLGNSKVWKGTFENPEHVNTPNDLIYCIYTSGTTGKPKGVMIEHHGVVAMQNYLEKLYDVTENDNVLQFANYIFDASVWEMTLALYSGATLVLIPSDKITDTVEFEKYIIENNVTLTLLPPQYFRQIDTDVFRVITTGGSASDSDVVKHVKENCRYINAYGPTENTVLATHWEYEHGTEIPQNIPIGKPISNSRIYILNGEQLCGIGVPGELCIAGDGVARGYLNRPELTAEKFVENPYGEGKMYRSGDLARWLPDGNIVYMGRIDQQVKIRGFRIELGEIESKLREIAGIQDCAVIARMDQSGEKAIYAYYISHADIKTSAIRDALSESLPEYMIPSYMMQLEKIPVTRNGKLDVRALPEITVKAEREYVAPRNETEDIICRIFEEILHVEQVGIQDSFFELGGHSLRATRLVNEIEVKTGIRIALKEVFSHSTPEQLAVLVSGMTNAGYVPIPKAEEKLYYPMSSAQKRTYLIQEMQPESVTYNMPYAMKLTGDVQPEKLKQALQEMINRHEILRTVFEMVDGEAVQRILEYAEAEFEYVPESMESDAVWMKTFVKAFDLKQAPQIRMQLVNQGSYYLLMLDMHHIVGDGMSMNTFMRELTALYNGEQLTPLTHQFKDYSEWMRSRDLSSQEAYWKEVFSEEVPVLDLPLDYIRPQEQQYDGAVTEMKLHMKTAYAIEELARKTGATEYMIFLAAAMVMLSKYSRQEDIVIGSPISGRTHKDTEGMLGMFVNTLAMRGRPEGEKTFEGFLSEVKADCLKAYENQEYPFESLVEAVEVRRDLSRNPLFDVMLVLQNNERLEFTLNGVDVEEKELESTVSKFDLSFNIVKTEDTFAVAMEYSTALFQKETVERMLEHYEKLLQILAEKPEQKLKAVEMITQDERKQILEKFNHTEAAYPKKTIVEIFEEQVAAYEEKTAVVFGEEYLTYAELNEKANVIAHKLREQGVKRNDFVAILAERSIEMIVGIYGILKAGGAYVPIDPTYPEDRIRYILEDCKPKAVLTYHAELETERVVFDLSNAAIWEGNPENAERVNTGDDLIYCIYTSGTTGNPKGVMNRHQGIVNLIYWMQETYPLKEQDVILQKTTYVFDVSASEIFWWQLAGATLALSQKGAEKDPVAIAGEIEQYGVTVVDFVPSMLSLFLTMPETSMQQLSSLKYVLAAGEALNAELVRSFYEEMKANGNTAMLGNIYGPTEASVYTTWYECERDFKKTAVPIGKPISNMQVYIVDEGRLCGIGVPGELCIAGDGVAGGYLNRPELTAE
ncbi:MAG: amino acid adenylation domain-containing protein, partial [Ruminococcus sp.]